MRGIGCSLWLFAMLMQSPAGAAQKIKMIQGRPVVQGVYVNGHGPYEFLLDTGTTANHLDPKLAKSIGLSPTFRSQLISSTGTVYVPGAEGIDVVLDSARASGQRFLFAGIDVLHQLTPEIQGILGQAFLSHFDYRLDLRSKNIEFGRHPPASAAVHVPLHVSETRPLVSTNLGALVLDSGTPWVTLFGLDAGSATGEITTLTGSLRIGMVSRKLLIDGHPFWSGAALAVPHSAEQGAAGLLPLSVFKAVYFSNSEQYVSFE